MSTPWLALVFSILLCALIAVILWNISDMDSETQLNRFLFLVVSTIFGIALIIHFLPSWVTSIIIRVLGIILKELMKFVRTVF